MRVNDTVCITILDHCMADGTSSFDLIEFEVYGRVISLNKKKIVLAHWLESNGLVDRNTEVSVIVRSAVKKVKILR